MSMYEICFSPTGGTQKCAELLTRSLSEQFQTIDLTNPHHNFEQDTLTAEDIAVIAVPSYGGRAPSVATERLTKIHANGARAVLLCVYGNRAYEDTLVELQDSAEQAGFQVIATVAAIAEHSIARQYAAGRPDAQDAAKLKEFAAEIRGKLEDKNTEKPSIPGNRPYKKEGAGGMVPKPTKDCTRCGVCAEKCPVQAIDKANPKEVDSKKCISCMRCIEVCPHSARKLNSVMLSTVGLALKKVCSDRKEPELYL